MASAPARRRRRRRRAPRARDRARATDQCHGTRISAGALNAYGTTLELRRKGASRAGAGRRGKLPSPRARPSRVALQSTRTSPARQARTSKINRLSRDCLHALVVDADDNAPEGIGMDCWRTSSLSGRSLCAAAFAQRLAAISEAGQQRAEERMYWQANSESAQ